MENYKVRVNNEAESKEAQVLFFALGCKWRSEDSKFLDTGMDSFYILVRGEIMTYDSVSEVELNGCGFGFKELTLPELRDLVVLKRNDVNDATHACESMHHRRGYLSSDGIEYIWFYGQNEWFKAEKSFNEYGLKPIEKTMKEYLNEKCELITAPESEAKESHAKGWLEVPEGADFYAEDGNFGVKGNYFFRTMSNGHCSDAAWLNGNWMRAAFNIKNMRVLWQRNAPAVSDDIKTSQVERDYKEISQEYKHYKKDVSNLNSIDVYRVLKLFDVKDPALQHAVKKILCAGDRGTKDKVQDIQEAIASLNRSLEMIKEDDDIPF